MKINYRQPEPEGIKNLLFLIVLVILFIPGIQGRLNLVKEPQLDGAFTKGEKPTFRDFTIEKWADGTFQEEYNQRLEQNIGFRNFFVRIQNQISYSLYGKANAEGVVVGKGDMLFEEDYIREYLGMYYVGDTVWEKKAARLKAVQDTLARLNKKLLVVFEPDKASIFPELIPAEYANIKKKLSNYDKLKGELQAYGVNILDINQYFKTLKGKTEYPLFGQCGTHWSYYGATLAADSTLKFIEKWTGKDLPDMRITENRVYSVPRHPDYDIGLAMNLFFMIPHPKTADPILKFDHSGNKSKPGVLVVGDSFFFNWLNNRIPENTFNDCEFWYYNKKIVRSDGVPAGVASERNLYEEIMKRDIIMIMITGRFMHAFAWDFDEQMYNLFYPGHSADPIEKFSNELRIYGEEFRRMYEESVASNISLQDRIKQEAEFLFYDDLKKNPGKYSSKEHIIKSYELAIKGTPDWLEQIKKKAKDNNISVDEQVRKDAEWLYEDKYGKKE